MVPAELDALLQRACRRDAEAVAALVDVYAPRVFGLLLRLTGSRDAAEDLTQETLLRVLRTIDSYEHAGKFEPWLFRIAANLARDQARSRRRRGTAVPLDGAMDDEASLASRVERDSPSDPTERLEAGEQSRRLLEQLEALPEMDREILLLRHYAQLPFREIADLLGIPLGTALARVHRALAKLRRELGGPDEVQP